RVAPRFSGATIAAGNDLVPSVRRRRKNFPFEFRLSTDVVTRGHTRPGDLVNLPGVAAHDPHRDRTAARRVHRDLDVFVATVANLQAPILVSSKGRVAAGFSVACT